MKQLATYKRKSQTKPYSSGFTLLEILVSIVVLSFGLLGMVGIQAMALKSNNDAKQQSAGVQLASELSDMMRGNKAVAVALTTLANPYLIDDYTGGPIIAPAEYCNGTSGCSSALRVAEWEKYDWLTRVNETFPGARVQVCYDNAPYVANGLNAGLPQWGCGGIAAAGGAISIKIGWTRDSTNKTRVQTGNSTDDAAVNKATAFDTTANSRPLVIYVLTPGSST